MGKWLVIYFEIKICRWQYWALFFFYISLAWLESSSMSISVIAGALYNKTNPCIKYIITQLVLEGYNSRKSENTACRKPIQDRRLLMLLYQQLMLPKERVNLLLHSLVIYLLIQIGWIIIYDRLGRHDTIVRLF